MKKIYIKSLILIMVFFTFISTELYSQEIRGRDSTTGSNVWGNCSEGDCRGRDVETGANVYGNCDNGQFRGRNKETGDNVYGSC